MPACDIQTSGHVATAKIYATLRAGKNWPVFPQSETEKTSED